jgi:hypothetical protein
MHRALRLLFIASLLSATCAAHAARLPGGDDKALPCRPTIACTADIVSPGSFELETGMLFRRLDARGRQWTFPFLAKLTLARWIQLQVGSNGYTSLWDEPTGVRYFDDLSAGAKLHLVDQGTIVPSVSVSAAAAVPVMGAQPGYAPAYGALSTAYVTKDIGPIHADLNLGFNVLAADGASSAQEWVALALSGPLPPPFGVMVETYYFTPAASLASRDGGLLFALSYTPKAWLVFDAGGDVGYFPSVRPFSAFVGMTVIPAVLWP